MRGPDSRGSKNRLGHSRPFSQPLGHKEMEGGMNLKETLSSYASDCITKRQETSLNIYILFLG